MRRANGSINIESYLQACFALPARFGCAASDLIEICRLERIGACFNDLCVWIAQSGFNLSLDSSRVHYLNAGRVKDSRHLSRNSNELKFSCAIVGQSNTSLCGDEPRIDHSSFSPKGGVKYKVFDTTFPPLSILHFNFLHCIDRCCRLASVAIDLVVAILA